MGVLTKLINFLLYTNLWIAGAAASLFIYSRYLVTGSLSFDITAVFLITACTWLYSLHRFIGLHKVGFIDKNDRYFKIKRLRNPILIVAILAFIATLFLAFYLTQNQIKVLLLPGVLSLLYVLPILKNQKRLRDVNYIKIFVIAIVWAGLTVMLPLAECADCIPFKAQALLFLERFIFIFAITLPFDIRDIQVDKIIAVKTIPAHIGQSSTAILCFILLAICSLLMAYLAMLSIFPWTIFVIQLSVNLLTFGAAILALNKKHDWYFTGVLDGTMYLPLSALWLYLYISL